MLKSTLRFIANEQGQDMVEYSLLCVIIGCVVIASLTGVGTSIQGILTRVGTSLDTIDKSLQ